MRVEEFYLSKGHPLPSFHTTTVHKTVLLGISATNATRAIGQGSSRTRRISGGGGLQWGTDHTQTQGHRQSHNLRSGQRNPHGPIPASCCTALSQEPGKRSGSWERRGDPTATGATWDPYPWPGASGRGGSGGAATEPAGEARKAKSRDALRRVFLATAGARKRVRMWVFDVVPKGLAFALRYATKPLTRC